MKKLTLLTLFLLFGGLLAPAAEYTPELREPTPLEKEGFALLKKKFPGDILTADLETLHELAQSREYQGFLAKAFPPIKPIPMFAKIVNFDEVIHNRLPPKERYLTYYTQQFGVQRPDEVTDTEHFLIHHEVVKTWIHQAIERSRDIPTPERAGGLRLSGRSSAQLMRTMLFRKMLAARFGINPNVEMSPEIMTRVVRHIGFPILNMTKAQLTAEARWIQTLFEKHGPSEGMLWVALQAPILFESIRYAFTTDSTFLKYVYTDPEVEAAEALRRHKKRLQEFKEWQNRQKEPESP